jgi:hypothetical protein
VGAFGAWACRIGRVIGRLMPEALISARFVGRAGRSVRKRSELSSLGILRPTTSAWRPTATRSRPPAAEGAPT